MTFPARGRLRRPGWRGVLLVLLVAAAALLDGCAMVEVKSVSASQFIAQKRGDILTRGRLSDASEETLRVAGLEQGPCSKPSTACIDALARTTVLGDERRLATLSELWLQQAMTLAKAAPDAAGTTQAAAIDAWLETARFAYAYLFFTARGPGERAFEERQTQVRDYYNYAAQEAAIALFRASTTQGTAESTAPMRHGAWTIHKDITGLRLPEGVTVPRELIPAASLSFAGLRSTYRRDGFGAELVAVLEDDPVASSASRGEAPDTASEDGTAARGARWHRDRTRDFSEMPSPSLTLLLRFPGDDLEDVLTTRDVLISAHDPYKDAFFALHGQQVPLAANYTAGYGLWLARSDFAGQSLRTLLGLRRGIDRPHLYMMQPYDPDRRVIVMLHGLASSPEAWVNVANEVLGDETLRQRFQVWQVYYPTNLPLAINQATIRHAITETLAHFDPQGRAAASHDIVLIGHSMGGVLSRLLVSSSGGQLWDWFSTQYEIDADSDKMAAIRDRIEPALSFTPLPGVERAIFIAAPHRGTDIAGNRIARWFSSLIRLPLTVLEGFDDVARALAGARPGRPDGEMPRIPSSIDNLNAGDPFVKTAATLPISPRVCYHSIIARRDPKVPLADSDDGVVPYRSAHLDGAASEKIIPSGHSVQETAAAILEIRRILHEDLDWGCAAGEAAGKTAARSAPAAR
ncbi:MULTISPECIES: esterase/lipase family protein [Cupriavidus]|uniref:esterase/lipase family protein n=1 Tax=Cupriavidus TaxID=106589 RepID=UPI000A40F148|nr:MULTISPECIES: alpha/beta fold hydrolase [Cupriavidus]